MLRIQDYFPYLTHRTSIFLTVCLLTACGGGGGDPPKSNYKYTSPQASNDGIAVSDLQSKGISPDLFEDMVDYFEYNKTHSALVAIGGDLVFEIYLPGYKYNGAGEASEEFIEFDKDTEHSVNSVTKSVTSTLIGIAIDQALITSSNTSLGEYFSDYNAVANSPEKSSINLSQVLAMTVGLQWDETTYPYNSPLNDDNAIDFEDPYEYTLQRPIVTTPGTAYRYSGGTTMLLGGIIERASGIGLEEFAELNLFGPLGITNYTWLRDPNGEINAKSGLKLRPRDSLKLGQLFLNNGMWEGNQIVSESWVNESTKTAFPFGQASLQPTVTGYAYQQWTNEFSYNGKTYSGHTASGWGGQMVTVIEELEIVVVINSGLYANHRVPYEYITDYILPAVVDSQ